jgi:hypothetical protein
MRKSSKFIVVAGALAALAIPSVASASVNVDDAGNGFVGKGDVQTALGYVNDADFQPDAANITFTQQSEIRSTVAHGVKCAPLVNGTPDMTKAHEIGDVDLGHAGYTTKTITAKAKGGNGKVTGWNLTGASTTTTVPPTMNYSSIMKSCPVGETFVGYVDPTPPYTSHITPGGLMVSNGSERVALPNTPVEVASIA